MVTGIWKDIQSLRSGVGKQGWGRPTRFRTIHHSPHKPVRSTAAAGFTNCTGPCALLAFHAAVFSIAFTLHGITTVAETSIRVLPVLAAVMADKVNPAFKRYVIIDAEKDRTEK